MLFRDSQLRNRAHLNRLRQIDGLPGGLPGTEGDDDNEEQQPPVGPTATQPRPTSTRENPVASKPPASTSSSTPTSSHSSSSSQSRPSSSTTPPTVNSQTTPTTPTSTTEENNNAQPTVSNPLPGVTQTIDPGTIGGNNIVGYTSTYTQSDALILQPTDVSSGDKDTTEGSSNTIKYIGYAAGAIAGFAILVSLIMFIMRRLNKKRENEALGDVFDRNSFVRDSVAIPDHDNELPSDRGRPRPPTMIARHIGATGGNNTPFAGGYDNGYGGGAMPPMPDNGGYYGNNDAYNGNNGGYNGNGYDQYGAGHGYNGGYDHQYDQYGHYAPPQQGFASYQDSPMHSPMDPYSDHSAQYLNHQVGSEYPAMPPAAATSPTDTSRTLTRQPSNGAPGADYPNVAELGRGTSVTPYQAAQYAEIGKRLDDPTTNGGQGYNKVDRHPSQQRQPTLDDAYGGI